MWPQPALRDCKRSEQVARRQLALERHPAEPYMMRQKQQRAALHQSNQQLEPG